MTEPYETKAQAHAAAVAAIPPEDGRSILTAAQNRRLLFLALEAAGVPMGRYGDVLVDWLAGLEDSMCAEIARWVTSAAEPPEGTVTEWGVSHPKRDGGECRDVLGEQAARAALPQFRRTYGDRAALVSRQVGPWTEAGTEPGEDGNHGEH